MTVAQASARYVIEDTERLIIYTTADRDKIRLSLDRLLDGLAFGLLNNEEGAKVQLNVKDIFGRGMPYNPSVYISGNMDQKRKDSIVAKLSGDKYFATVVNQQQRIVEDRSHERADIGEGPIRRF